MQIFYYLSVFKRRRAMKRTIFLFVVTYLAASCQWSPERDNPIDPYSVGYREPPRSPQIETFKVTTHCYGTQSIEPYCEYELECQISDSDGNLGVDPRISVFYEEDSLGLMSSDPMRQLFVFRGRKDDLPNQSPWNFYARILGDTSATATKQASFSDWEDDRFPTLSYPPSPRWEPWEVTSAVCSLSWLHSSTAGGAYYGIEIYLRNLHLVWDTVGIDIGDTIVAVTKGIEDASTDSQMWYAWYLTEFDTEGNSATSIPGWFRFFPPDPFVQPLREEQNDY
jgi:hypothetical protein